MAISTSELSFSTAGDADVIDITSQVQAAVEAAGAEHGQALAFVRGSTAAITTMEFEPGGVADLRKMLELREFYRLIIGFRYKKLYSTSRVFISFVYNLLLRWVFRSPFRDVSTGIRAFHRSVLDDIELTCDSPFIGAELAIKAMLRGYPVGEVGIQTFPRKLGSGSVMTLRNVLLTMRDVAKVRNRIFSDRYHLPRGRQREETRADG